jgi:hypothetical protein
MRPALLLLLSVLWGAVACATVEASDQPLPRVRSDPRYDALFPYYVELCAVSQIRANFAEHGGTPGHAAMYVKGACRDPSTEFPTLKVCDAGVDLADPEAGSGVSVNKMFSNVNWMAIPGKRLFYFGNLQPDEVLDVDRGVATLYEAEAAGIFSGVEIHGSYRPPPDDEKALLYLAAAETLGTDFALTFGRTVFCSRLPLDRRGLEDLIGYLNGLNREYALGEASYNWSGYNDNCSHTLHNALAAAGVWKPKSVGSYKLRQLVNLSVPANEFADLALLTTSFPIDDFDRIHGDRVLRESLLERGWLPTRHGALMKLLPVHQENELYDTRTRIFMLQHPLRRSKGREVGELFRDPRNTDLEANLIHFEKLYARILEERPADRRKLPEGDERRKIRAAYYDYVEAQLEDVRAKLERLRGMPHRPPDPEFPPAP